MSSCRRCGLCRGIWKNRTKTVRGRILFPEAPNIVCSNRALVSYNILYQLLGQGINDISANSNTVIVDKRGNIVLNKLLLRLIAIDHRIIEHTHHIVHKVLIIIDIDHLKRRCERLRTHRIYIDCYSRHTWVLTKLFTNKLKRSRCGCLFNHRLIILSEKYAVFVRYNIHIYQGREILSNGIGCALSTNIKHLIKEGFARTVYIRL